MRVMVRISRLLVCPFVAALCGCSMGWYREGVSSSQGYQDIHECQQEAARAFPTVLAPVGSGYQSPSQTNCQMIGNQMNCTTYPGVYRAPPQQDVNMANRNNAMSSCMRGRGYTYKMEFKQ